MAHYSYLKKEIVKILLWIIEQQDAHVKLSFYKINMCVIVLIVMLRLQII